MVKKKTVLMIGIYPPVVGGITTHIQTILNSSIAKKYKIIEFSTNRPTLGVYRSKFEYNAIFDLSILLLIKSFLVTFKNIIKSPIYLFSKKIDIVHIHTPDYLIFWENSMYLVISKIFNKKTIIHIHATSFPDFYKNSNRVFKILIKKILNMSDKTIILSKNQISFYKSILDDKKIMVLNNTVDFNKYNKDVLKNHKDIVEVVFIGGKEAKRKGIEDIIKSIQVLKDKKIKIIILGDVDKRYISICKSKDIDKYVEFKGFVTELDKINILNKSDIYILPSYAEGLPISILEAMSAGLAVVSTFVGSIPDVIEIGENGYLINPGEYKKLAYFIKFLAENEEIRKKISRNNKEKIRNFYSIDVLEKKLNSLYDELVT